MKTDSLPTAPTGTPARQKSAECARWADNVPPLPPAAAVAASSPPAAAIPATAGMTGAAVAIALLRYPNATPDVGEEIAQLCAANRALLADAASTPASILASLGAQLFVLESLAMRLIIDAEQAKAEQRVPLLKLALAAQSAWLRTASALLVVKTSACVLPT